MKTGIAHLPLHYGSTPRWLFEQMTQLAREVSIILITEKGTREYLRRLADPYWFQAFGCLLGFDWHSSGLTTTTCAALKKGLKPIEKDLGFFVCGGKGKTSRKTPQEIKIKANSSRILLRENLIYASKMVAKVDNNALQDSYQLYHHTFFFDQKGNWAVVQQGMNLNQPKRGWARRYHWLADKLESFVNEPHQAIAGVQSSLVLNLVAQESQANRQLSTLISHEKPEKIVKTIKKLQEAKLPLRHQLLLSDINPQNLKKIFLSTYQQQPKNFEELLRIKGVGAKTLRALALISELIYGAPASTRDPARYSFAHGGKDGTPYPIDQKTYRQSIEFLKEATNKAKLGYYQKLHALRRLARMIQ